MQELIIVVLLAVFSLASGACAYWICRRIRPSPNVLSVAVLFCLPLLGGAGYWAIPFLVFIGLISNLGSWGYRKSLPGEAVDKKTSYRWAVTATLLALPLGLMMPTIAFFGLIILLAVPTFLMGGTIVLGLVVQLFEGIDFLPLVCLYYFGLLLTPSLMPFLLRDRTAPDSNIGVS
jgi:hypothetical protein